MDFKDNFTACEFKFDEGNSGEFEGYASVFNSNDKVNDTIIPGAFEKSLEAGIPKMFINHNHQDIPVGDWVKMEEDEHGLFGRGRIDMNHHLGPSTHSAMKRGAMTGLSIGFTLGDGDFDEKDEDGHPFGNRNIKNMDLREVSIVTFPCEPKAQIEQVKLEDFADFTDLKGLEAFLRESCKFSRSAAAAFVGRVLKLAPSDSGPRQANVTDELTQLIRNLK